jgi:hypothetical protein
LRECAAVFDKVLEKVATTEEEVVAHPLQRLEEIRIHNDQLPEMASDTCADALNGHGELQPVE